MDTTENSLGVESSFSRKPKEISTARYVVKVDRLKINFSVKENWTKIHYTKRKKLNSKEKTICTCAIEPAQPAVKMAANPFRDNGYDDGYGSNRTHRNSNGLQKQRQVSSSKKNCE